MAPGSIGEQLFNFLNGADTGSKTFVFDRLSFDTGKATLKPESEPTLAAISQILKAFPHVQVSVDGYTDNQGGGAANRRISESRARTVADALVAAQIERRRIAAHGHGATNPIADNGAEDGRAKNRRTELTATKT